MQIKIKKTKRNDNMYVFSFKDIEEKDFIINTLKTNVNMYQESTNIKDNTLAKFTEILNSLHERIDNKYATEEYQCSGILFQSELIPFISGLIVLNLTLKNIYIQDLYINMQNSHEVMDKTYEAYIKSYEKFMQLSGRFLDIAEKYDFKKDKEI